MKDKPWWLHTDPHSHFSILSSSNATTPLFGAISATSQNPYFFTGFCTGWYGFSAGFVLVGQNRGFAKTLVLRANYVFTGSAAEPAVSPTGTPKVSKVSLQLLRRVPQKSLPCSSIPQP